MTGRRTASDGGSAFGRARSGSTAGVHAGDDLVDDLMLAVAGRPVWVVVAALAVLSGATAALGVAVPAWVRYLPLAVSLLAFGLPHGAVDHLAAPRAAGRQVTRGWLAAVGLVYLCLGGGYAALWLVAPTAGAALFVALTWFHWGQGDLYALDRLGAAHLTGRWLRAATVLLRGGLPMLVPLLAFPERYRAVVAAWVALFGRDLGASWLFAADTRAALGVAFAGLTVATLTAGRWRAHNRESAACRGWRLDAGETALLWVYFLVVPPVLAVGVYFCVWHSLRHAVRLVAVDDRAVAALDARGVAAALGRVARDAAPLTAVSVVLLVGFGVVVGPGRTALSLAALYLVFIAVLTLPHVAVVTWMDHAEGGWRPASVSEQ